MCKHMINERIDIDSREPDPEESSVVVAPGGEFRSLFCKQSF